MAERPLQLKKKLNNCNPQQEECVQLTERLQHYLIHWKEGMEEASGLVLAQPFEEAKARSDELYNILFGWDMNIALARGWLERTTQPQSAEHSNTPRVAQLKAMLVEAREWFRYKTVEKELFDLVAELPLPPPAVMKEFDKPSTTYSDAAEYESWFSFMEEDEEEDEDDEVEEVEESGEEVAGASSDSESEEGGEGAATEPGRSQRS